MSIAVPAASELEKPDVLGQRSLDGALDLVLDSMARCGLHQSSSKFFAVYAHENLSPAFRGSRAGAEAVKRFISWFKKLGLDIDSDRSPHGWAPDRGREILDASNDILANQMCLLPPQWDKRHADWVLVFGSELLGEYIKDEDSNAYMEAVVTACREVQSRFDPSKAGGDLHHGMIDSIKTIQKCLSKEMKDKFHHVLTELALVQLRKSYQKSQHIVPVLLSGSSSNSFPEFIVKDNVLLRIEVNPRDLYSSLFKILLRFEAISESHRPLIERFQTCFESCRQAYASGVNSGMTHAAYLRYCEAVVTKTTGELRRSPEYQKLERQATIPEIRKILDLHAKSDCWSIKRISGGLLPSGSRDIDLVFHREDDNSTEVVLLRDLFNERKIGAKKSIRPERIFIRGSPGVGKSTLSKRIANQYSWDEGLRNSFDLVVRLSLARLRYATSLQQLLLVEFFGFERDGAKLAKKLADLILDQRYDRKILLVLDGLDEAISLENEKRELLLRLLRHGVAIITSRFYAADTLVAADIDLQLEAVGLSTKGVLEYLQHNDVVPNREVAAEISDYINNGRIPGELVRLPIYLDMLCFSWTESQMRRRAATPDANGNAHVEADMLTMTDIYQTIVEKLWRKDIPNLGKLDHGQPVTQDVVQAVRDRQRLERVVEPEILLLGKLSTLLLGEGRVEFTDADIDRAIQELESKDALLPLSIESNLPKLSFLQHEVRGARHQQQVYRFIHLTFQEFFAANYLVRDPVLLSEYLCSYKYNRHYGAVWKFAAGLLPSQRISIDDFFCLLEREPRDLVGLRHARLLTHCLSQCERRVDDAWRRRTHLQLLEWARFEKRCNHSQFAGLRYCLSSDAALPEEVFLSLLKESEEEWIIKAMAERPTISRAFCHRVLDHMERDQGGHFAKLLTFLSKMYAPLPLSVLERLLGYWECEADNPMYGVGAYIIKEHVQQLPESVSLRILGWLELRRSAGRVCEEHEHAWWVLLKYGIRLADAVSEHVAKTKPVRWMQVLSEQPELPSLAIEVLLSEPPEVWVAAVAGRASRHESAYWHEEIDKEWFDKLWKIPGLHSILNPLRGKLRQAFKALVPGSSEVDPIWDRELRGVADHLGPDLPADLQNLAAKSLNHASAIVRWVAALTLRSRLTFTDEKTRLALKEALRTFPWEVLYALQDHTDALAMIQNEPVSWLTGMLCELNGKESALLAWEYQRSGSIGYYIDIPEYYRLVSGYLEPLLRECGYFNTDCEWSQGFINCLLDSMSVLRNYHQSQGSTQESTGIGSILGQKTMLEQQIVDRLLSEINLGSLEALEAVKGRMEFIEDVAYCLNVPGSLDYRYSTFFDGLSGIANERVIRLLHRIMTEDDGNKSESYGAASTLATIPELPGDTFRDMLIMSIRYDWRLYGLNVMQLCRHVELLDAELISEFLRGTFLRDDDEVTPAWIHGSSIYYYDQRGEVVCQYLLDEKEFRAKFRKAQELWGLPAWAQVWGFL
ncbi:hypothetical protein MFIFM68171_07149 [Madurella fahalii]|uniref:NACHT domain-containing protein n=1 Tax=Madurella fahalii TaxID=1157608 RepID=A0ABQ0GGS4_9PEZI